MKDEEPIFVFVVFFPSYKKKKDYRILQIDIILPGVGLVAIAIACSTPSSYNTIK